MSCVCVCEGSLKEQPGCWPALPLQPGVLLSTLLSGKFNEGGKTQLSANKNDSPEKAMMAPY